MKTIIAGGRNINAYSAADAAIAASGFVITEVVSGTAGGVDRLGEQWANSRGLPVKRFPADWGTHGRKAGPIRNLEMAKYAEALIAVWDGSSRGTKNMIDTARRLGLRVFIYAYRPRGPKEVICNDAVRKSGLA